MTRALHRALAAAGLAAALSGCSLGTEAGASIAGLRLVNGINLSGTLAFSLDRGPTAFLRYQEFTGYAPLVTGGYILFVNAGASQIFNGVVNLTEGRDYTVMIYGTLPLLGGVQLEDDPPVPDAGHFKLRLVHGAVGVGPVDIHFTAPGAVLDVDAATVEDLDFDDVVAYAQYTEGSWRLRVTAAGTLDVVYDSGELIFGNTQARTMLLLDGRVAQPGDLLDVVLLEDN